MAKFTLGLIAIVKNEDMVIDEWIKHYIWQGVDHFYIIDNGSTDKTRDKLYPYVNQGVVSYYYMPEKFNQTDHYNQVYIGKGAKDECQWIIVCDVDEYIYNRIAGNTLKQYIWQAEKEIASITIAWKMFGSSGHVRQPGSIRRAFVYRKKEIDQNFKSIINTAYTTSLGVHDHAHTTDTRIIRTPDELALNHYAIMSAEYFEKVKMKRGDVAFPEFDNFRNWDYFKRYDFSEFIDNELYQLLMESKQKCIPE